MHRIALTLRICPEISVLSVPLNGLEGFFASLMNRGKAIAAADRIPGSWSSSQHLHIYTLESPGCVVPFGTTPVLFGQSAIL
jgi:hypothetical protein